MPQPATQILLVEGVDDEHVVKHIWTFNQNESLPFQIKSLDGIDNLIRSIHVELKLEGIETLGIVVDANDDIDKRWNQVTEGIQKSGNNITVPSHPHEHGTVIPSTPRIGIWMMPDNQSKGELESFVHRLIPKKDKIWPRTQRYLADIPDEDRKFKPQKELSATVHAWLAVREKPRRMGAAIRTRDLDGTASLALKFNQWLCNLFVDSASP